jgi:hypothetical protein
MMSGGVLAELGAAGSIVSNPALRRPAVAVASAFLVNNVFPFNLPLLKRVSVFR